MIILIFAIICAVGVGVYFYYKGDPVPYSDYEYSINGDDSCSCMIFSKHNAFSEYDCDSEPSSMVFTGEYYTRYRYDKKKQTITLYSKYHDYKPVVLKVIDWTVQDFTFQVLSSTFECGEHCVECSINHKASRLTRIY